MHSFASHRARILASPAHHEETAGDTPPAQLSRQAALFRRLREGTARAAAADPDDERATASTSTEAPLAGSESDPSYGLDAVFREPPQQDTRDGQGSHGDRRDGGHSGGGNASSGNGDEGEGHARDDGHGAAALMQMQTQIQMHYAMPMLAIPQVPLPAPSAAPPAHAVSSVERDAMQRLTESIVAEVGEFCANPAVVQSGNWQITIPIDSALLPECTLSLALSHFQLTLRFETALESSRQLISMHVQTLHASLTQLMQSRLDGTRSVEITVT
ncbi:hypothetical protein C0Z18_04370 [Trinickia dabaoshanensis]|uniref:Type III secretion protein HpaP n=1 Tax=Trinickia dabaoshanensis TaxID=564714 RepID=A0A2N7VZK5_9BURK|nr:type III secretion system protein SctP [Trinickia dabaoshanensis]PMS22565.1 hypothetical protein C0Z18_04370 [Trinickia dabaoshanensis]